MFTSHQLNMVNYLRRNDNEIVRSVAN